MVQFFVASRSITLGNLSSSDESLPQLVNLTLKGDLLTCTHPTKLIGLSTFRPTQKTSSEGVGNVQ